MGDHLGVSKRKKIFKTLNDKKTAIIVAVFLTALIITTALLLYVRLNPVKETEVTTIPALQVGEILLTKERYSALIKQAKEQNVDENTAKLTLQESMRSQEIARQLKLVVPDYLIAAQGQSRDNGVYVPYQNLSDYQREDLYPKALSVVLSLAESGGSLNSVLYAAYDPSQDAENNRMYAEKMVNDVKSFKNNTTDEQGKKIDNPFPLLLADFTTDQRSNFAPSINRSGLVAVTDDGRQLYGIDEFTVENKGVENSAYDKSLFAIIQPLKKNELSDIVRLQDRNAYVVINKHETYAKSSDIRARYTQIVQELGV